MGIGNETTEKMGEQVAKSTLRQGAELAGEAGGKLLKTAGIGAGLVIGASSLAMITAAITGKCGGNMFGMIAIGDCTGDYSMSIDTEIYTSLVRNYETRITQTTTNTGVITNTQDIEILMPPQNCKITVKQNFKESVGAKVVVDTNAKSSTVRDISNTLEQAISEQFKEMNGFLSAGTPGPDISSKISTRIKQLFETDEQVNNIVTESNNFVNLVNQRVRINYGLDSIKDSSIYTSNNGCEINIEQNTIVAMQFDSMFQTVVETINNDSIVNDLALQYQRLIERENKGVEAVFEAIGKWFENIFKILIVAAVIGIGALYFLTKGSGTEEGSTGTSSTLPSSTTSALTSAKKSFSKL